MNRKQQIDDFLGHMQEKYILKGGFQEKMQDILEKLLETDFSDKQVTYFLQEAEVTYQRQAQVQEDIEYIRKTLGENWVNLAESLQTIVLNLEQLKLNEIISHQRYNSKKKLD
ncbi:hypothetical protein HYX13_01285 [Candidatus Woesearchaeota archaeon]|nr:hypothetical protein [Candidatus Woesearchaeota archaeon]